MSFSEEEEVFRQGFSLLFQQVPFQFNNRVEVYAHTRARYTMSTIGRAPYPRSVTGSACEPPSFPTPIAASATTSDASAIADDPPPRPATNQQRLRHRPVPRRTALRRDARRVRRRQREVRPLTRRPHARRLGPAQDPPGRRLGLAENVDNLDAPDAPRLARRDTRARKIGMGPALVVHDEPRDLGR